MVDVFILTFNRLRYLKTFIKFLYKSTKTPFRLFVIDNGSLDGTREYILDLEKQGLIYKHLFNEQNMPLALAYTTCFNKFKDELNEFIVTAPDDIVVNPEVRHDWLDIFIKKMKQDDSIMSINFVGSRCLHDKFLRRYDTE